MRGSVEELLDVATDLLEAGQRLPGARVSFCEAPRLALGGDCVEDVVARAVGKVVLAEHAGIVGLGVGQRNLVDPEAVGDEQRAILAAHADGRVDEGFAQLLDLVAGEALLEPLFCHSTHQADQSTKRWLYQSEDARSCVFG